MSTHSAKFSELTAESSDSDIKSKAHSKELRSDEWLAEPRDMIRNISWSLSSLNDSDFGSLLGIQEVLPREHQLQQQVLRE